VRYDARGYGETTYQPEAGWAPVEDAVAVLDAAEVESAVVVAGSMGGAVALDLALAHPHRVRALVLIGSAVRGAPYPELTDPGTADLVARAEAVEEAEDWDELNRLEAWLWLDGPTADDGRVGGSARELFLEMHTCRSSRVMRPRCARSPASWTGCWTADLRTTGHRRPWRE
jgi:pimeloyl-ACP methyl ester carboxylesterase